MDSLTNFLGSSALVLAICCIMSPSKSLYEGLQKMEIKNITIEYFLFGIPQTALWMLAGYKLNDIYVYMTNIFAVILMTTFLDVFLYINRKNSQIILYDISIFLYIWILNVILSPSLTILLATLLSSIWQFASIRSIRSSLQTKNSSYINLLLAFISAVNFGNWFIYSLLTKNYLMAIPHFLGNLIWSTNIFIYYWTQSKISHDHFMIIFLKWVFIVKSDESNENKEKEKKLLSCFKTAGADDI